MRQARRPGAGAGRAGGGSGSWASGHAGLGPSFGCSGSGSGRRKYRPAPGAGRMAKPGQGIPAAVGTHGTFRWHRSPMAAPGLDGRRLKRHRRIGSAPAGCQRAPQRPGEAPPPAPIRGKRPRSRHRSSRSGPPPRPVPHPAPYRSSGGGVGPPSRFGKRPRKGPRRGRCSPRRPADSRDAVSNPRCPSHVPKRVAMARVALRPPRGCGRAVRAAVAIVSSPVGGTLRAESQRGFRGPDITLGSREPPGKDGPVPSAFSAPNTSLRTRGRCPATNRLLRWRVCRRT